MKKPCDAAGASEGSEILIGDKQYIACMAPARSGGLTHAVYCRSLLPDGKSAVLYGASVPKSEADALAISGSRYIATDAAVTENVIFYDGTGQHTRKLPFLSGGEIVYRYMTDEDARRVGEYFTSDYTLKL